MTIPTNPYNFERRKTDLVNNKEKSQEEKEKKFLPNTRHPHSPCDPGGNSVRQSKASLT